MTTEIVTTGGEVAVGVGIGMTVTDTMGGIETIVDEAGATVPVLITIGAGEGGTMMMKGGVGVLFEVVLLTGFKLCSSSC